MVLLLAAVYLGWTLGANNTANVFGPGVTSEIISYRLAIILTAGFVVLIAHTGHTVQPLRNQAIPI